MTLYNELIDDPYIDKGNWKKVHANDTISLTLSKRKNGNDATWKTYNMTYKIYAVYHS